MTGRSLEDRIALRLVIEDPTSDHRWQIGRELFSARHRQVSGPMAARIAALEAEDSWDPQGGHDGGQGGYLSDVLAGRSKPLVLTADPDAMRAAAEDEAING